MKHIINNIISYINSPKTDGAFQLKGEWGSGKTYFFKEILPEKIKNDVDRIQVMISLFGLSSVKEIPFRLLNAYINKKGELTESVSEEMNHGLDYLDMKYGVDRKLFGINLHDEEELIYNILPKENVYLCFDDVERFITKDNVEEIMGAINNLVENMGYKVIVIYNDHYHRKDDDTDLVKSMFKEKVIGSAMTFAPPIMDIYNNVVDEYKEADFSAFMKRNDVSELFIPQRRNKTYCKDFRNIRNMKFAISNFNVVFNHYRGSISNNRTIKRLKYYLAFIIGVSIEYKKDILTDGDCHGINVDTEVYSFGLDDDDMSADIQELFNEYEETKDEKEKREKKEKFDSIYRRRFYSVYAKDVGQRKVFHEELFNFITTGNPIDYEKLESNLETKLFAQEITENPGNDVVVQSLDATIFNYSNEEIKGKMLTLLNSVADGNLLKCAAYVNAFSFLYIYKSVIGKTPEELLDIFKSGISKYITTHEIDRMEGAALEMVSQDLPSETRPFYAFLQEELHKMWEKKQTQGIEEMISAFKTDIYRFCGMFIENNSGVTIHYKSEAVLQNIPQNIVAERMHTLTPKDVHELAMLVNQRYNLQDIYAFRLQREDEFLAAMKRGIESIEGDDTVSKVETKVVLLNQVDKALRNFDLAK